MAEAKKTTKPAGAKKPAAKKTVTKPGRQLKELKDLSVKEITALEYKRLNLLLQESKKAISRKRVDKFNVNKFALFSFRHRFDSVRALGHNFDRFYFHL